MNKGVVCLLLILISSGLYAQEKIEWTYDFNSDSQEIIFTAEIEEGWHLYSQYIDDGIGPVPMAFNFNKDKSLYRLKGRTIEPDAKSKYDPNFEGELSFFEHSAQFSQKLKVKKSGDVSGVITFMACNDEMCLPPADYEFKVTINK